VTQRLKEILSREGIHVEVLTTAVPPEAREAWYERQLKAGMQVCISHPRLVATGMDLLAQPTILFYESGYSTFTLRQASRRSWRIGQTRPVKVKFMAYAGTMQESCLRLMGKKLLVSLAMEGKFASHGLQSLDEDDDMLTAMARELVTQKGVGERADELWKQIQRQQATLVECSRPVIVEPSTPAVVEDRPSEANRSPLSETAATANALIEMALESPRPGRKSRYDDGAQLSLAF
jgi:hypothetical protein